MSAASQTEPMEPRRPESGPAVTTVTRKAKIIPSDERLPKTAGSLRYLEPADYPAWDALVDISPQGSPYSRTWWLRALGGEVRLLGYFRDGRLRAGIPLYFEKRLGVSLCTMPKLTQTLGPVLPPPPPKSAAAASEEMEILTAFATELAKQNIFFQAFHRSLQNWSPFFWNGFTQSCRAIQVVDVRTPEKLWDNLAKIARYHIRRAQDAGIVVRPCSPETVWQAEEKTFQRQNMRVPHSIEYISRLCRSAEEHQAGQCFAAVDAQERVHAAVFLVWDRKSAIGIASGVDPDLRKSGAMSLLMWHSIQFASQRSELFDFGGSMLQPIEQFQRSFGTRQVPYMWIMKFPLWLKLYLSARGKV